MSIEGKHSYRFGYLKSEQWSNVRVEALAREKGFCQICGHESITNDAHHVWYPQNIYETTESHLVILCRPCHNFIHLLIPECKTSDESEGREHWLKFYNAIKVWRREHIGLFEKSDDLDFGTAPHQLRNRVKELKLQLKAEMDSRTVPNTIRKEDALNPLSSIQKAIQDLIGKLT